VRRTLADTPRLSVVLRAKMAAPRRAKARVVSLNDQRRECGAEWTETWIG
ncbi:MAG: hypothetical protein ACI9BK_003470, partial [Acidimicrobiales bacterium]